jgi:hypothetical protein
MKKLHFFCVIGVTVFSNITTSAHAALIDRGGGLIYDDVQDLTWTQNAQMFYGTQSEAMAWAENLVFGGFDDWRLPTTAQFDDPTCSPDARNGVNYSLFYEHRLGCTGGEMEQLAELYDPWNNEVFEYVDDSGRVQRYIDRSRYWTSTPYRDGIDPCIYYPNYDVPCNLSGDNGDRTGFYWQFGFTGYDGVYNGLPFKTTLSGGIDRNAWAVRDGDVISAVPLPAAAWLFGSGLLGLTGIARRRKPA